MAFGGLMDALDFPVAVFGLLIGLLVWSRTVWWVHFVWVATRDRQSGVVPRLSLAIPAVLHSGPWLLAATIALAAYILMKPHSPGWNWFFGGMLATPLVIAFNVSLVLRRRHRRKRAVDEA